ncbi:response regulator [Limibaculum sp. M0105]|uniref:Response regulator n=1 Tax=Thermohalobaculum xanthum TaxID=2753746 RepID=A0A8J7SAX3_9RHOB|nr:response regulator [Thermohalobaculum xanthum]MBK0398612.1 response regulator [Thermohalobaculum xanthum]
MAQGSTPDTVLRECLRSGLGAEALRLVDAHVDLRLPHRIVTGAPSLRAGVSALCAWLAQAPNGDGDAVAIWQDNDAPLPVDSRAEPVPILIEVARRAARSDGTEPASFHPDLLQAADALGAEIIGPSADPDGVLRLGLRFTSRAAPSSSPLASHWGKAMQGRRLLVFRRTAFDRRRVERSLAALGLVTQVVASEDAALDALSAARREGKPYDLMLVGKQALGADPVLVLRRLQAPPGPVPRIVLVDPEDTKSASFPGVERIVPQRCHWRRVIDALCDLAEPEASCEAGHGSSIPAFGGRRILIAEDVRTNQALLRAMLAPTGANVTITSDGAQAVEAMQTAPADLVLMDIQMPVMDGLEAARQIRALGHPARIIALTAHARDTDRARYLSSGMDGYLAKPIRVDDLYAVLADALAAEAG